MGDSRSTSTCKVANGDNRPIGGLIDALLLDFGKQTICRHVIEILTFLITLRLELNAVMIPRKTKTDPFDRDFLFGKNA